MAAIGWWVYLSVTYFPRQAQSCLSLLSASGWFEKPAKACSLHLGQTYLLKTTCSGSLPQCFPFISGPYRKQVSTACALSKCMTTPVVTDPIMEFLPFLSRCLCMQLFIHIHSYVLAWRFQPPSLCCVYGSHVPSFRLCKLCFFWSYVHSKHRIVILTFNC